MYEDNYLVLDFETTNINKGDSRNASNHIVLSVFGRGAGGDKYNSVRGNEFRQDALAEAVAGSNFIVAHNAKFELGWLRRCGIDISNIVVFDTMIAEYVIQGNRKVALDLDNVAKRYGLGNKGSLVSKLIKGGVCPSEIHPPLLYKYCYTDVALTELLFLKQLEILKEEGLLEVFITRCKLTPVLAELENQGMYLDAGRVAETYERFLKRQVELDDSLNAMCEEPINWASPQQLAGFIYGELGFEELTDRRRNVIRNKPSKKFPEGAPKTDAKTLDKLKATNSTQRSFVKLRTEQSKVQKAISTYLSLFSNACEETGGVLKGNFNQCVTATHRLSSSNPNFQNFSREFKPLFTCRNEGWKIAEVDFAQLEFRVAAFLGNDIQAIKDIEDGFDVHQFTADIIGCSRQEAKAHTFKPLMLAA